MYSNYHDTSQVVPALREVEGQSILIIMESQQKPNKKKKTYSRVRRITNTSLQDMDP